ncbi:hypothetical protein HALLA_12080 [Halostagnicola larsenii XH-48]|uniref:Calcineurin-like phosphoesterase domain-containing protein n=1 Tax=Halostagnicola larsenii XH-48 TaxID=797299 RepID=W0JV95_9EURY|nr:hypothetical protein [Halostagnicola larsenii]AHG00914.1 hypothetical protein HALLA_11780 [Halostagnicola larsenii XH-48]AHG00963.1 hypothetical protein HALLA_12080 [Halostagnicola larsenii XH-48]
MVKIGLLADTHIADSRRTENGVSKSNDAVSRLNSENVDWNVHLGDIRPLGPTTSDINWGNWATDNKYYKSDFEVAQNQVLSNLNGDLRIIARGNHDRPLDIYREYFPRDEYPRYGSFEEDGVRHVWLDTHPYQGHHELHQVGAMVSPDQISFLHRLMDDDPDIPTFVYAHAPLAAFDYGDLSAEDWYTDYREYFYCSNAPHVQNVLERGNVVMVNNGHLFNDEGRGSTTVNGVEYVLSRHLVHNSDTNYTGDVRWLDIDTTNNEATCYYYDVGADSSGTITTATW